MSNIPTVVACDVGNSRVRLASVCGEDVSPVLSFDVGHLDSLASAMKELWHGGDGQPNQPVRMLAATSVNPHSNLGLLRCDWLWFLGSCNSCGEEEMSRFGGGDGVRCRDRALMATRTTFKP